MGKHEERQIIRELKNGKEEAYKVVLDTYGNRLMKTCYLILNDEMESEDVVQETFLRVFKNIYSFKGKSSLYTWIYSIAMNLCRDSLRKRTFDLPFNEDLEIETLETVEESIFENIDRKALRQELVNLPPIYKEVLVLFYFEGLSIKEISEINNENIGTIKSKLSRGRNKLKESLMKGGDFDER